MKLSMKLVAFIGVATLTSCSHMFLKAPLVSMTESNLPSLNAVEVKGPVNVKWCKGDPVTRDDGSAPGLADEVISKAQKKLDIDYIRNAQFVRTGGFSPCVILTGEGLKKVASAGGAPATGAPTKAVKKSKKK